MVASGLKLLWVIANNTKTGEIPSAYVGTDVVQAWESCDGCALREDGTCYAWNGLNAVAFSSNHVPRYAEKPEHFSLPRVLARLAMPPFKYRPAAMKAKAARIGVLGDPSRADRGELLCAVEELRRLGFRILGYTHFWREPENQELRTTLMASCNDEAEADEALALGWRPACVLPWNHEGARFKTAGGAPGVVCPAQTKDPVTCNSCRMCDPTHPVWDAEKVKAIGFINHSPQARAWKRRTEHEKTLTLFAGAREARTTVTRSSATTLGTCGVCGSEFKSLRQGVCGLCESRRYHPPRVS